MTTFDSFSLSSSLAPRGTECCLVKGNICLIGRNRGGAKERKIFLSL